MGLVRMRENFCVNQPEILSIVLRFSGWLTQIFPHMRSKPIQNRGFEWVSCARVKIFVSTNLKSSVQRFAENFQIKKAKNETAHVQYLKDQRKNWKGSLFAFLEVARTLQTAVQRFSGWLSQNFSHMRDKPIQNRRFEWVS